MPGDFLWTSEMAPVCELGLSDVREPEPDSWMDVSCFVHECEIATGRERFGDRFDPGTASITFDNRTGWGDLVGSPAVVATQTLRPGRPLRVGVDGPWGRRWLFRGWIDRCSPTYDPVLHDIVTVECIDALGEAGVPVAPTGPLVGANETVDVRLNRVLDAVGWFPTKRIIGASTTTVTATTLGSRAIDHMSQAADSAGGVVYGDLDGNVVYEDIGWELFDPDDPPDDTIGNVDPGTPPIPWVPGYIDPVPGYVYDPDPPPITERTVVMVCADGTEGTLVRQGEQFQIFARDGRLLFSSSGHTWDLGDFTGGCVAVAFDPETGEPTRWDKVVDPDTGEPVWEIAEFDPVELEPALDIELIAFAQAGIADGVKTSIELGPVMPGPDCLLFLMVVCHTDDGVNLGPAPTGNPRPGTMEGGGLDWYAAHYATPGIPMSKHTTVAQVGRDDPGLFMLTLTYGTVPEQDTSKSHIAVLYRVRNAAPDLYQRYVDTRRAWSTMNTGPGDGPTEVEVTDFFTNYRPLLRPQDAGLAVNLAGSATPPFGATFESSSGAAWTIPPMVTGISRYVSWNTGWRTNGQSVFFGWDDVNSGSELIASGQCVMVAEPSYANAFHWQVIDWRTSAPASGILGPTGQLTLSNVFPDAENLLVVFVGLTADHDASDAVTITQPTLTFTRVHRRAMTAPSRGQGVIFTAVIPPDYDVMNEPRPVVRWPGHTIESIGVTTFEVWKANRATPTGAVASTLLGTNANGSVDGAATVTLPAAPQTDSAVFGFVFATKDASTSAGVHTGGDDYVEEVEFAPATYAYLQAQSRASDVASALDPDVDWNDVQTGTAVTRSGIAMAIEIRPEPGFWMFGDDGSPLVIGGETDAFNGPIFSAERRDGLDPNEGDVIWQLDPLDVVVP